MRSGTFASLGVPNFRRYFTGQAISLVGTWMQIIAQSWLVLDLSGSGTVLGAVTAAQFLPLLLLGSLGGVLVDRSDKRRVLLVTQTLLGLLALALGLVVVADAATVPIVFGFAVAFGLVMAVDQPARQALPIELVGRDLARNAVTLNSVLINGARAVGPAVGGVLIATVGTGACFLINAATFVAAIASIALVRPDELHRGAPAQRQRGAVREGWSYVRATPQLFAVLVMMALVGTLAYEFQVTLPILAREHLHVGAGRYGLMTTAMGVGAVVAGLAIARMGFTGARNVGWCALAFGAAMALVAAAPGLVTTFAALVLAGAASVAFLSTANATLQLESEEAFRGRVMALWSIAFLGSTPLGGPVVGWVAETVSAPASLLVGTVACVAACAVGVFAPEGEGSVRSAEPDERRRHVEARAGST
ncbi:MAG: transporter [Thermoleophilia bacterium]|nr:transporter [Thermoleophilia bacterium]